ncbi:hypothetical protein [Aeromonas enteropelogenes]|uniref:hypothetical protein n=1 Tax=Aeromonas enteropelogenes TaxID=29489 RepID=UPI003BA28BBA
MKPAEVVMIGITGILLWSEWQDWQLNRDDAIELAYKGAPAVSVWQCGTLKQRMADIDAHRADIQFQYRGQDMTEVTHYLQREWKQMGCEQLLMQQGY